MYTYIYWGGIDIAGLAIWSLSEWFQLDAVVIVYM
jgi:hypothetical protein